MTEWRYKGKIVKEVSDMPDNVFGFIYKLKTIDGRAYIGKKQIFSKRKRKFGKKEIAKMENKRLKKWEYVFKESDWKEYTGSNKELNDLIKRGVAYSKEILFYANGKNRLSYLEVRELWKHGVLESEMYFNANISGRYFNQYKK